MRISQVQGGRPAQLGLDLYECLAQAAEVEHRGTHDDVEVARAADVAMSLDRDASDDDEINLVSRKDAEDLAGLEDAISRDHTGARPRPGNRHLGSEAVELQP